MFDDTIKKIFESEVVSGYLSLQKTEMNDEMVMKLLALKPGEINIILARTASFIRNDSKDKTRKELINEILEVLERSAVARKFIGLGLKQEYHLFHGFPVRKGDTYENLPDIRSNISLKPSEVYIGWSTDAAQAREEGAKYDATKGEPVGGLLVETHVDSTKILLDINGVLNAIKLKLNVINQYNTRAAPGKSISKANIDFLATQAPAYHGQLEVITSNKIVNVMVSDKWTWTTQDNQKVPQWTDSVQQKPQHPTPVQENIRTIFESLKQETVASTGEMIKFPIHSYHLDEGFKDTLRGISNWISKTAGVSIRGKTLKYMEFLYKQYASQKLVYELAIDFIKKTDDDLIKIEYAEQQIMKLSDLVADVQEAYQKLKAEPDKTLTFAAIDPDEDKQENRFSAAGEPQMRDDLRDAGDVDTGADTDILSVNEEKITFRDSLKDVFNESVLNIFSQISDSIVSGEKRVSRKQLDKIFNKLVKSLTKHYLYRTKALEIQLNLLETDYNSYKGSRFENLPAVKELGTMVDHTKKSLEIVNKLKNHFETVKEKASGFTFNKELPADISGEKEKSSSDKSTKEEPVESPAEKEFFKNKEEIENLISAEKKADALDNDEEIVKDTKKAVENPDIIPFNPGKSAKPEKSQEPDDLSKIEPIDVEEPELPKVEPELAPIKMPTTNHEPEEKIKKVAQASPNAQLEPIPNIPKPKVSAKNKIAKELEKFGFVTVGPRLAKLFKVDHPDWREDATDPKKVKFYPPNELVKSEPVKPTATAAVPTTEPAPEVIKQEEPKKAKVQNPSAPKVIEPPPTTPIIEPKAINNPNDSDSDIAQPIGTPELPVSNKEVGRYMETYAELKQHEAAIASLKTQVAKSPINGSLKRKLKNAEEEYGVLFNSLNTIAKLNPKFPTDKAGLEKLYTRWLNVKEPVNK